MRDKVLMIAHHHRAGMAALAQMAAGIGLMSERDREHVIVVNPATYVDPIPDPRPAYEQLGYTKREMERNDAKAAAAEAKRQRRRERNQRHSRRTT